jgi:hypothetical protein
VLPLLVWRLVALLHLMAPTLPRFSLRMVGGAVNPIMFPTEFLPSGTPHMSYVLWAFVTGLTAGVILTRWHTGQPNNLISNVKRVRHDVLDEIDNFVMHTNIAAIQSKKFIATKTAKDINELITYCEWACEQRYARARWARHDRDIKPYGMPLAAAQLTALAIICEKCLEKPLNVAVFAMLRAKRYDDYNALLTLGDSPERSA